MFEVLHCPKLLFRKYKDRILTDTELNLIRNVCKVLKPFALVSEKLSAHKYPTISIIRPALHVLTKACAVAYDDDDVVMNVKNMLAASLEEYLAKY